MLKKCTIFLLLVMLFVLLERSCYKITGGFRTAKTQDNFGFFPEFSNPPESEEKLNQNFHYLGSGKQFYAFLGDDKKTVLKLFKIQHLKIPFWINLQPNSKLKEAKIAEYEMRQKGLFSSLNLAWNLFKEESGLLLIHLNKTKMTPEVVTLYDKIGAKHLIKSSETRFILQSYAHLIFDLLEENLLLGKKDETLAIIRSYIEHVNTRTLKGLSDHDPVIFRNLGVFEGRVITIDLGSLYYNPSEKNRRALAQEEIKKALNLIKERFPELKEDLADAKENH